MKKVVSAVAAALIALTFTGCFSAAYNKSREISRDANEFGVTRRITVINTRTDTALWQLTGDLATFHDSGDLDVIVDLGDGRYVKHFFDLNEWTTYIVEDVIDENLPEHYYEVEFMPDVKAHE